MGLIRYPVCESDLYFLEFRAADEGADGIMAESTLANAAQTRANNGDSGDHEDRTQKVVFGMRASSDEFPWPNL